MTFQRLKSAALGAAAPLFLFACVSAGAESAAAPRAIDAAFAESSAAQAPFGDAVSPAMINYTRVSPYVATAGAIGPAGLEEAAALGFRTVIDLRQPSEDGVAEQASAARAIDITYVQLPLQSGEAAWAQIDVIGDMVRASRNHPVLIHCGSANRAGAAWALYRARLGVDGVTAIEEGRMAGMTSREPMVRALLGLPEQTGQ